MTAAVPPEDGLKPAPRIDDRKEPRIPVSWRGQLVMPNGLRDNVRVRDISESGLGMVAPNPVPNGSVITISMGVPDLTDPSRTITVTGKVCVAFVVIQGHDYRIGGQWVDLPSAQRDMIKMVIKRGRFG
jgi:hypothetical protein